LAPGSFVGEKKLRFDFTKNGNKSFDKSVIEKEVNTIILLDLPIFIETVKYLLLFFCFYWLLYLFF
jgi:alanyl-tRNA synthetase